MPACGTQVKVCARLEKSCHCWRSKFIAYANRFTFLIVKFITQRNIQHTLYGVYNINLITPFTLILQKWHGSKPVPQEHYGTQAENTYNTNVKTENSWTYFGFLLSNVNVEYNITRPAFSLHHYSGCSWFGRYVIATDYGLITSDPEVTKTTFNSPSATQSTMTG